MLVAGMLVAVFGAPGLSDDSRVLVGGMRVRVGWRVAVCTGDAVSVGTPVLDGVVVIVGRYCDTAPTVNAAMVFIFERAESTRLAGPKTIGVFDTCGPAMAAAETRQNKLKPIMPAASTVSGPAYCRILTVVTLPN